jgi:hypothetical protein
MRKTGGLKGAMLAVLFTNIVLFLTAQELIRLIFKKNRADVTSPE